MEILDIGKNEAGKPLNEFYDETDCDCEICIDDRAEFSEFICISCGFDTLSGQEYYMILDSLWKIVNPQGAGMKCIGCVEEKLGRTLNRSDFTDAPINNSYQFGLKSDRLLNRLFTDAV
jgi:hypothetical protein